MSTRLIAHLKKKCEADDNVKILLSQWEFDQKLVGKALENIGGFYPHFSNHNASHSQQILVNIERILGDDIDLLSATDTWLILEAAYWHDVGMLVDAKNAKEVHSNPDFNFMIQTIANEKGHDLQKFCQAYVEKNWLSAIGTVDHPFDGIEQYRKLVAEWFRRGHDKRVGKIVEDPFKDLGITSPRTELLPNRIYRYLGQICVSHGMDFDVLMEKLPYKQTGLGTENCHPRFIGCLLRLGDLFDLDDNRFCPVMAKHVSNMPSVSKHHHDKHLSLREFQLDKRTVKLVAECPDEMSYVETQNWFGWIREEFQNQMSQWNLIVPSLKFGSLPTIEQLDVKMEVKYENGVKKEKLLLNNKPMKFALDEINVMEILQGANLYKDKLSIFRELIQNAVDATMLRIYLSEIKSHSEYFQNPESISPEDPQVQALFEQYCMIIKLVRKECANGKEIWSILIKDQGVGISLDDLNFIQNMASSSRNIKKAKNIVGMPKWMGPSGEFGIGLHSTFLLTKNLPSLYQTIIYRTKNISSNEYLEIQMNSPLGEKKGYCFISKINNADPIPIGTTTEVHFSIDESDEFSYQLYLSRENIYIENYDLRSKLIIWEFYKSLSNIALSSLVKIKLEGFDESSFQIFSDYEERFFPGYLIPRQKKLVFDEKRLWSKENNLFFKIKILNPFEYNHNTSLYECVELLFKGQRASLRDSYIYMNEDKSIFDFFSFEFDFYGLNAKSVLTINRDNWKKEFIEEFYEDLFNILNSIHESYHDDLRNIIDNDFYFRLLGYCLGKIPFNDLFTVEDINNIFHIDISKEPVIIIGRVEKHIFIEDERYPSLSPRSSYLMILLKKYLVTQGKKIYKITKTDEDGVKEIGDVCLAEDINITNIIDGKFIYNLYSPSGKTISFNDAIIQSFKPQVRLKNETYFYLYIELQNIQEDIEKHYQYLILLNENKILSPFYIYHGKLIENDIQSLVNKLFDKKIINTTFDKERIVKIYEKLREHIVKIMEDTNVWKDLNEPKNSIDFID